MSKKAPRLMVMAGGSGGHVFPGLAVAHYLQSQGWEIRWLGTRDRMEAQLVPKHGIEIDFIQITGLRGKGVKALLTAPFRIARAISQAKKIMRDFQPDAVLGMGGFVSGPGGVAAWRCGIPVILHEQNGVAGLTNGWLAKIATTVLQGFPGAFPDAPVVGNPVREDILNLPSPAERFAGREGPVRILIIGGSQGARVLNQTIPEVAGIMGDAVCIRHQAGKGSAESTQALYDAQNAADNVTVTEFIDDMVEAYTWADVVICRSGALTVSEIAAVGLGAIFVPFMHKDRQQYWNAQPLEQAGAAAIIEQPSFSAQAVADQLREWDRPRLLTMAEKAKSVAVTDATKRVADAIIAAAEKHS